MVQGDIGLFLKNRINAHLKDKGQEITVKYIDPSCTIHSMPANAHDSAFCLLLGLNTVTAGIAGRTDMLVGFGNNEYNHLPISMAVSRRKQVKPEMPLCSQVLACTGQPAGM